MVSPVHSGLSALLTDVLPVQGIWVKESLFLCQHWAQSETRRILSNSALRSLFQRDAGGFLLGQACEQNLPCPQDCQYFLKSCSLSPGYLDRENCGTSYVWEQAETRRILSQTAPGFLRPKGFRRVSLSRNWGVTSALVFVSAFGDRLSTPCKGKDRKDLIPDCS